MANTWEQRRLGSVAIFNPKSTLPDEFEYVDLESVVGTDMIAHRTETKDNAPSRAQRLALYGDVFYQTVRPYQKNNYLYDLPYDNYVFSTGYAQMRPNIDSYFLLSRLQEEGFVKLVLDRCTGTSYPAINSNDLADIEIKVPVDRDEQSQVGSLFRSLDHLITLHQRMLLLFFIAVYISLDNDLITKSVSWFSSSCIMCKYVFCVVVILECPNRLATLAIVTPSNNSNDAWV